MKIKTYELIVDYLENPSKNKHQDIDRRTELAELLQLKNTNNPSKIGEKIVEIYYEVLKIPYERNVKVPVSREEPLPKFGNPKRNYYLDGLENKQFYVEVKTRAYQSGGTAGEKIPSIAFKYGDLSKKLKIFLLADDEHTYNLYWSKLIRGDIISSNPYNSSFEEGYKKIHTEIIEKIIYGTEIAKVIKQNF
jgi:hypothetical protein